jgi:hypothetical protein
MAIGRPKGSLNKKTAEKIAAVEASGETPLDYMLRVMRDPTQDHARRDDMAKSAAGYIHARLASTETKNTTTVRYVARIPEKANDAITWQQQHLPSPKTIQ